MENITTTNPQNQNIADQFTNYYNFIYSSFTGSAKVKYYKLQAIKNAIVAIGKFKKTITKGNDLKHIKGVGEKTVKRIDEILETGILAEISYKQRQLESVKKLSTIFGIGSVKARELYEEHGITDVADLKKAVKKGEIELTEQMTMGLKYYDKMMEPIPRQYIDALNGRIQEIFVRHPQYSVTICGSYRRGKEFSNDVDILVSHRLLLNKDDSKKYLHFVVSELRKFFLVDDLTTNYVSHYMGYGRIANDDVEKPFVRCDIITVPYDSLPTALLHFTGSATFNQKIRLHAKKLGFVLNEYGLFKGKKRVLVVSEADVFDKLLLRYIPPNLR
jgi:DNA polymerase/3'-5' exonuclease PolX